MEEESLWEKIREVCDKNHDLKETSYWKTLIQHALYMKMDFNDLAFLLDELHFDAKKEKDSVEKILQVLVIEQKDKGMICRLAVSPLVFYNEYDHRCLGYQINDCNVKSKRIHFTIRNRIRVAYEMKATHVQEYLPLISKQLKAVFPSAHT